MSCSVVAVSGTLQDGFPLRNRLNYYDQSSNVTFEATFLGWGLVRGVKSYFDIKDRTAREYTPLESAVTSVNPALVVTGNRLDANLYALYLVHEKALLCALLGEPRYLSMTPDTVRVDLTADETSHSIKMLFAQAIKDNQFGNSTEVAVLAVVSTYKAESFVENPPLYTKSDGTQVTNFHEGLAKWAGTSDKERGTPSYNQTINEAIRRAEQERAKKREGKDSLYGTTRDTMRLNKVFKYEEFSELARRAGVSLNDADVHTTKM